MLKKYLAYFICLLFEYSQGMLYFLNAFSHCLFNPLYENVALPHCEMLWLKQTSSYVQTRSVEAVFHELFNLSPLISHFFLAFSHLITVKVIIGEQLVNSSFDEVAIYLSRIVLCQISDKHTFIGSAILDETHFLTF